MTNASAQRQGIFDNHGDTIAEASSRAALTRRRYRVRKDIANRLWFLQETHRPISAQVPMP